MKASREWARRAPTVRLVAGVVALGAVSLLPAAAAAGASSGNQLTVSSQTIGKMGKVLVVNGRALYTLTPSASPCNAACLKIWPAVTMPAAVTRAAAGSGVHRSKLGVTAGPSGTHQVTYNGRPLYWFALDKKGTVKGNVTDQWGKWTDVVVAKPKGSTSGSSSNSGSGANAGGGGVNF